MAAFPAGRPCMPAPTATRCWLRSAFNERLERREQPQHVVRSARLDEVMIEAHQRGEHAIGALRPLPGDGDEQGRLVEVVHLAQLTRDCESADARHLDVEDHRVGPRNARFFEHLVAAVDALRLVALIAQDRFEREDDIALVVGDEHAHWPQRRGGSGFETADESRAHPPGITRDIPFNQSLVVVSLQDNPPPGDCARRRPRLPWRCFCGNPRTMELDEFNQKLDQIEEQAQLTLAEFPKTLTKERQRMIIALVRYIRAEAERSFVFPKGDTESEAGTRLRKV